jgi:hypothetical protein
MHPRGRAPFIHEAELLSNVDRQSGSNRALAHKGNPRNYLF